MTGRSRGRGGEGACEHLYMAGVRQAIADLHLHRVAAGAGEAAGHAELARRHADPVGGDRGQVQDAVVKVAVELVLEVAQLAIGKAGGRCGDGVTELAPAGARRDRLSQRREITECLAQRLRSDIQGRARPGSGAERAAEDEYRQRQRGDCAHAGQAPDAHLRGTRGHVHAASAARSPAAGSGRLVMMRAVARTGRMAIAAASDSVWGKSNSVTAAGPAVSRPRSG